MAITYLEISYPNFVLGAIIDPAEANQNNNEIVTKINLMVDSVNLSDATSAQAQLDAIEAISIANGAVSTANSANTKADNAVSTSNSANTKADNAVSTSNSADVKADGAIITANGADIKADTAISTANSADVKADTAISIANSADVKADTAISTANSADVKADTAISIANSADVKADTAIADSSNALINSNTAISTSNTALGQDTVEPYTGALGAMRIATEVEADYLITKADVDQALIDVESAVLAVADKASLEYVNNSVLTMKDEILLEVDRKEPVATFSDLATTYPSPVDGWLVLVRDSRNHYVYNGVSGEWEVKTLETAYADEAGSDGIITSETFISILNNVDKLAGIEAGAEVNVNADWNASSGDAQILNKPTIPDTSALMPKSGGVLENYREKLTTLTGTSTTINLSLGNVFTHSLTGNTTYTISNAVSGQAHSFTLIINMGSTVRTLTFPASVKWQGGEIPDLSTADMTYVLTFITVDGGTTWLGMFGGEF